MNQPLTKFFIYRSKQLWVIIAIQFILPIFISYFLTAIFKGISSSLYSSKIQKIDMPSLPQPNIFIDDDINFIYFSASPNTVLSHQLLENLTERNSLVNARLKYFTDNLEADSYFNEINIHQKSYSVDINFARDLFCQDVLNITKSDQCNSSFLDDYNNLINERFSHYKGKETSDHIFIHFNILESEERIQSLPKNITVQIIINDSKLRDITINKPDTLYKLFAPESKLPYWSGYSYTLQKQIDEFIVAAYTNISYKIDYSYLEPIKTRPDDEISICILFNIANSLSFSIILICATFTITQNRESAQIVLRRLGVLQIDFHATACLFTLIPTFFSYQILFVCGHFMGILPFSAISVPFCVVAGLLASLITVASICFLSVLFGNQRTKVIIFLCVICLIVVIIPVVFHYAFFFATTFFDPSLLPQWGTWLATFFVPVFGLVMIYDSMFNGINGKVKEQFLIDYRWEIQEKVVGVEFLMKEHSKPSFCILQNLGSGKVCVYYVVQYVKLYYVLAGSCCFFFLLSLYLSHIIPQKGFYGLQKLFFLRKDFWKGKKMQPKSSTVQLNHLSVQFKRSRNIFKNTKTTALDDCNFSLQEVTSALIGESGAGKTTLLGVIAGDVKPVKSEITSLLSMETFDLTNPIHAYYIKPFIGYCPQDFSNVFLDMSVFQNVYRTLKFRQYRYKLKFEKDQILAIIRQMLDLVGLGTPAIQRRQAQRLSGGMLRRLACVNAIVGSQNIVLFDEISAGVDPVLKRKIWELIKQIQCSVMLTTHDMTEVEEVSNSISFLDKGNLYKTNQSISDIRNLYNGYSLVVYFKNIQITEEWLAQNIPYCGIITNIQRFSAQIGFEKLDVEQVVDMHKILEMYINQGLIVSYSLSKYKLQDIYFQLQQQRLETNIKEKRFVKYFRNKTCAMMQNMFKLEFAVGQVSFSYILTIALVCITFFLGIAYNMVLKMIKNSGEGNIQIAYEQNKQDLFEKCVFQCQQFYSNQSLPLNNLMNQCFKDKPQVAFEYTLGKSPYCLQYNSYLGLDYKSRFIQNLGDYRVQNDNSFFNYLVVDPFQRTNILPYIQQDFNSNKQDQSIPLQFYDYAQIYSYNNITSPLLSPNSLSLQSMVMGNQYLRNSDMYYYNELCKQICDDLFKQFNYCQEKFSQIECNNKCDTDYKNDLNEKFTIIRDQNIQIFSSRIKAIKHYNNLVFNKHLYYNGNYTVPILDQINRQDKNNAPFGIVNVYQLLQNQIKIEIAIPISQSLQDYDMNHLSIELNPEKEYLCSGLYNEESSYYNPGVQPTERSSWFSESQNRLPSRNSIVFFDRINNILTQQTSAVLRRELFRTSSNYEPWNFTYSVQQTEMPNFSDKEIIQYNKSIGSNEISILIQQVILLIAGFLPFFFTAQAAGYDCEQEINMLFRLHNIKKSLIFASQSLFYSIVAIIMASVSLLLIYIIVPLGIENLSQTALIILFYYLQSIANVPTGVLLGKLLKSGKYSSIVALGITIMVMVFQIIGIRSDYFMIVISIFLPSFGYCYIIGLLINGIFYSNTLILVPTFCYLLQFAIFFMVIQSDRLRFIFSIMLKHKKVQKDLNLLDTHFSEYHESNQPFFTISNVSHKYEKTQFALNKVSFNVAENRVFGLLGSNGSGKSTLMHSFAGLILVDSGSAVVGKVDLYKQYNKYKKFTMVPQKDIFYEELTVNQILNLFSIFNETDNQIQIISTLELESVQNAVIKNLSGGVRRKVSLAIALTSKSDIIALDEPSTGLGAITKHIIQKSVQKLIKLDKTVLLTTHDLNEVACLVDDLILLKNGEIVFQGEVDQMRERGVFVVSLAGSKQQEFENNFQCEVLKPGSYKVKNCKMSKAANWMRDNEVELKDFDICQLDLELDFMRLIGE